MQKLFDLKQRNQAIESKTEHPYQTAMHLDIPSATSGKLMMSY